MSKLLKALYNSLDKKTRSTFFEDTVGVQPIIYHFSEREYYLSEKRPVCYDTNELNRILNYPLPFSSQFLEFQPEVLLKDEITGQMSSIRGCLIKERSPGVYKIHVVYKTALFENKPRTIVVGTTIPVVQENFPKKGSIGYYIMMSSLSVVEDVLELINTRTEYGETKESFILKKGFGLGSYRTEINKVVHLRPYKFKEATEYLGNKIDWSHRWKVRGHWRKCNSVGKDRNGEYGVDGFTWVIDHIRGPEEKQLIEKTYLLNNADYKTNV